MDNGVDFKVYLSEQLRTIKDKVENSLRLEEVKNDEQMVEGTKRTIKLIEGFNVASFGKQDLIKVLKLQNLVNEYEKDAN